MTYRGLANLISRMPNDRKDSEALVFTPDLEGGGQLWNVFSDFGKISEIEVVPNWPNLSFDGDHPVLLVEN